jgi:transposase, IS5 family
MALFRVQNNFLIRFRRLLEKHDWAVAIFAEVSTVLSEEGLSIKRGLVVVDATLIDVLSFPRNFVFQGIG